MLPRRNLLHRQPEFAHVFRLFSFTFPFAFCILFVTRVNFSLSHSIARTLSFSLYLPDWLNRKLKHIKIDYRRVRSHYAQCPCGCFASYVFSVIYSFFHSNADCLPLFGFSFLLRGLMLFDHFIDASYLRIGSHKVSSATKKYPTIYRPPSVRNWCGAKFKMKWIYVCSDEIQMWNDKFSS